MKYSQFIHGEFCDGTSAEVFEVLSPSTGEVVGSYAMASPADVKRATSPQKRPFKAGRKAVQPNARNC